ncbi:MAG: prepilin-type N-terminal cleavage/methylation domain-containing protein [Candidatus Ozemobacteraceae bacterium]
MKKRGVTLAEVMVAVLIGSILSLAVTLIFSGSVRMTQKGTSHLTNIQNAAILMTQIEQDLERGTVFSSPANTAGLSTQLEVKLEDETGVSPAMYSPAPENKGYNRTFQNTTHTFCRGLYVDLQFQKTQIQGKTGFFVKIKVRGIQASGEENTLQRFIYCQNFPENRKKVTFNWLEEN